MDRAARFSALRTGIASLPARFRAHLPILRQRLNSLTVRVLLYTTLWAAIGLSLLLHVGVIYLPFLAQAFSTVSLSALDWLGCMAVASSVLWLRELSKVMTRATGQPRQRNPSKP